MAIDWQHERKLIWAVWKWWFRTGLLGIPFGIAWAASVRVLHRESHAVLVVIIALAVATNYLVQGQPPEDKDV
jgi:hypothetical protein